MSNDILIVDDESDIRRLIQGILEDEGYKTRTAENATQAYKAIKEAPPALVILDIWLQGSEHDGLQILENIKQDHPHMPILMISGHGTIETAVTAIKHGAYDFIEKPFKSDRLLLMINRALETAKLRRENEALKLRALPPSEIIGTSDSMQLLKQMIKRVAPSNSRILITGEPGTGKDLVARMIHSGSDRADKPYMAINCATLRPDRLEIELFGTEGGAMGEPAQTGMLEQADGGTLFLDEVSDMPLETQGKIVRVLQDQVFQRVGSTTPIQVDVRIIASTGRNLEERIKDGAFRQDLYYRLNVVPVHLPALRDHYEDIEALAQYFIKSLANNPEQAEKTFTSKAIALMQNYEWPGNIRQLRNVIEWMMIMNTDSEFDVAHLPPDISKQSPSAREGSTNAAYTSMPLREARELFEREYLLSQVKHFGGNISKTAKFVGMERSALHRKLKSLEINASSIEGASEEDQEGRKRA